MGSCNAPEQKCLLQDGLNPCYAPHSLGTFGGSEVLCAFVWCFIFTFIARKMLIIVTIYLSLMTYISRSLVRGRRVQGGFLEQTTFCSIDTLLWRFGHVACQVGLPHITLMRRNNTCSFSMVIPDSWWSSSSVLSGGTCPWVVPFFLYPIVAIDLRRMYIS